MSFYASFQGRVYLGKRDLVGNPIEVRSPGNVADLKLSLKTDVLEHYESQSGQRTLDHRMIKQKSATVSLSLEEFTKENLSLALYGHTLTNEAGTVTDELVGGSTPVVGDRYFLAHPKVSKLTLKDSTSSAKTLQAGSDYTADLDFGAIQFLRLDDGGGPPAPYVPPFKVSYSFGVTSAVGIFTQPLPERYVRFEGLNTAQSNAKVLVELYRVAFDPLKELALISDEYNKFELEGSLLTDSTKPSDAILGQFGRIVYL